MITKLTIKHKENSIAKKNKEHCKKPKNLMKLKNCTNTIFKIKKGYKYINNVVDHIPQSFELNGSTINISYF